MQDDAQPQPIDQRLQSALCNVKRPVFIVDVDSRRCAANDGTAIIGDCEIVTDTHPLAGYAPPLPPELLGDPYFKSSFGLRYAYVAGAMANGIASVELVEAAGTAGMLGFFGAGGLSIDRISESIDRLKASMGTTPYGFNFIHSPQDPELEMATARLYIQKGVSLVSAAAYLRLTLPLVYYRLKGIHQNETGSIITPNRIIAKISRIEVARRFFSPPPQKIVNQLLAQGLITDNEAALSQRIPMADTMTAEADSGGHTDNRPALALLPTIIALRNEMRRTYDYQEPLIVGLGGGIATPESTAAAFAMGAAYVLTGSINQACVESGTSPAVRRMLSEAGQADVTMAPAADMFQMGVKVQVLKRGTMFPVRAAKLYGFYSRFDRYEQIPASDRAAIEKSFFRCSFEEEWEQTRQFFQARDPKQIESAEADPKFKMALVFRSYLGRASGWAVSGEPSREIDYQVWCGPAMGAFNEWAKGSFLEPPENRRFETIALNLLLGASVVTRASWLRNQGIALPPGIGDFHPMELAAIKERI